MRKNRWVAVLAAVSVMTVSWPGTVNAAKIRIIGTDESEVETEAMPQGDGVGEADSS